tara:strand:+ start:3655 stop:4059 length:405 start_codon:yes stop_codon:yes gene_type:complete
MVNKKGYMKTLEAVFSVILLLVIIVSIVSMDKSEFEEVPQEIELLQKIILENIQNDEILREHVYKNEIVSLKDFIKNKVDIIRIGYDVQVCYEITCPVLSGNIDDVYVDSLILHKEGDDSSDNYLFRLYLWYNT